MPLMGSLVPWMWLKKEYVNLRVPQILTETFKIEKQREQNLKKEKRENMQSLWDCYKMYNIYVW